MAQRTPTIALLAGALAICLTASGAFASSEPTRAPAPQRPGTPNESWTIAEPDRPPNSDLRATVSRTDDGGLELSVHRGSTTVLKPSALGVETVDADFSSGLQFVSESSRQVAQHYTTPTGKRHRHHALARQTRLRFRTDEGNRMDLLVRVADDGVAYRYVLPESDGRVSVRSEVSAFRVPADARAWMAPWDDHYESRWSQHTVGSAEPGEYGYPALFEIDRENYLLLAESDVVDHYGATRLGLDDSDTFHVTLPDAEETARAPMATPWRTMITGDLGQVVESDLVTDLAQPSRVENTSWIEPGRVSWSWLTDHESPTNLRIQKKFVDYASRQGWEYTLVDEGWDADWVPRLVDYAAKRDVKILIWSRWNDVDTEAERDRLLPRWKSWGVAGVKLDFMDSDSQATMRWYEAVLRDTARQRLMVNLHGATTPHGLARTWPHLMTREAVGGAEYYTFGEGEGNTPAHNAILPYTRNVTGSMDYTPTTFSTGERDTSDGHELGLSVVYESGWQHPADSVESYRDHPVAERFLANVPADWDETRFVSGRPGDGQVVARRSGRDWYVGGIFAGSGREATVPLEFLPGGQWRVDLVHDGANGLVTDTHRVTRDERLAVSIPDNGGFAAQVCRAGHGRCGKG